MLFPSLLTPSDASSETGDTHSRRPGPSDHLPGILPFPELGPLTYQCLVSSLKFQAVFFV